MAEYIAPVHSHDNEFWERSYDEYNLRRKASYYSSLQLTNELRFYEKTKYQKGKPVRIMDVGGADGDVVIEALKNVPEMEVEVITVVEPCKRYADAYAKKVVALNTEEKRNIVFKSLVEGYNLEKLKKFHDENSMELEYDLVLLLHSIYYTGLEAVPELRDSTFLKPSGHMILIVSHLCPIFAAQKFAADHYKRFYPSMNPSKTSGKAAEDMMHFAVHDKNCHMTSYSELYEVADIVMINDIANLKEKDRHFLHFLTQRDLDPRTPAGELELRVYVHWIKHTAIRPYPYLDLEDAKTKEKVTKSMREAAIDLDRFVLPSPTNLIRLTKETMIETLTVNSAREATEKWNF